MRNLRNNGVLAYGIVITFSHEDAEKIDIEKSQQNNVKWLKNTFNLTPKNGKVSAVLCTMETNTKMSTATPLSFL